MIQNSPATASASRPAVTSADCGPPQPASSSAADAGSSLRLPPGTLDRRPLHRSIAAKAVGIFWLASCGNGRSARWFLTRRAFPARNYRSADPVGRIMEGDGACRSGRSEEHTSELQSLMRISYAVFCLKKNTTIKTTLHCYIRYTHLTIRRAD